MATPAQRHALLAIPCPWCGSAPGEVCSMPAPGRARRDAEGGVRRSHSIPVSTLDGGCHDARWKAAGLGDAPVLAEALAELQAGAAPRVQERPLEAAGAVGGTLGPERPW